MNILIPFENSTEEGGVCELCRPRAIERFFLDVKCLGFGTAISCHGEDSRDGWWLGVGGCELFVKRMKRVTLCFEFRVGRNQTVEKQDVFVVFAATLATLIIHQVSGS
jgi:hypothetical protein